MLVAQPVCHSAFDGDVRLGKYHARISRDGIFLRILAGIDRPSTITWQRRHKGGMGLTSGSG
jgi:hypothetical protein